MDHSSSMLVLSSDGGKENAVVFRPRKGQTKRGAGSSVDLELAYELAVTGELDDFAQLIRVRVDRVAVGRDQVAVRGQRQRRGPVQVSVVLIHDPSRPPVLLGFAGIVHREDGVVVRGRNIESVPFGVV